MKKNRKTKFLKKFMLLAAIFFIVILIWPSPAVQAADTDNDGITDATEDALTAQYAPVLYFKDGENFFPVDVQYHIGNSWLYNRPTGIEQPGVFVRNDPTKSNLDLYTTQYYYLENQLGSYAAILADYQAGANPYYIYCHVMNDSGYTFVQYWFFYAYNDGSINQHEGDWEMISIMLENTAPYSPVGAAYSQHSGGEWAAWAEVEKTDSTHPHVYVAKGSHANYFRPYQGKVGLESDIVGDDGVVIPYTEWTVGVDMEVLGELGAGNHIGSQDWLDYGGVWGDWENVVDKTVGFAGPYTPGHEDNADKWSTPSSWSTSLFAVDSLWFALCWFMYYLLYIILAIFALFVIRKLYKIGKLKKEGGLMLGEVLKTRASVGILIAVSGIIMTVVAIFLPWYVVNAQFTGAVTLGGDVFVLDGLNGVSVNFLVTGTGMTPLFNLGVPFSLIIGLGIILNSLDIIGVDKPKKLGNGYIKSGVFFIILIIIVLILMTQLGALLALYPDLPPEASTFAAAIGASPFIGSTTIIFYGLVTTTLTWGLVTGGVLLFAAAFVKILGGLIIRSAPSEFA